MTAFIQKIVESSLYGVIRAYNEWLGPEHHIVRTPTILGDNKIMTFHIDRTEKTYINWLVWTVHGFEAPDGSATIIRVRAKVSGTDIFKVDVESTAGITIADALTFNNYVLKDLHDELSAYTVREGWDAENINLY